MHVVPTHLAAGQNVVLAAVDDVEAHAQLLHHDGADASQVVQRALRLMRTARIVAQTVDFSRQNSFRKPIAVSLLWGYGNFVKLPFAERKLPRNPHVSSIPWSDF